MCLMCRLNYIIYQFVELLWLTNWASLQLSCEDIHYVYCSLKYPNIFVAIQLMDCACRPHPLEAGACRPYGQVGRTCKSISQKNSSSVNHGSKSIFNNVNFTLTIYSFCRLGDYFWSVDIKFWMMGAILVEFNMSCNVGQDSSATAFVCMFIT